jgi:hypothetical protein
MFIVIEKFNRKWPVICVNEDGQPLIFSTYDEAIIEKDNCQDGLIVEF